MQQARYTMGRLQSAIVAAHVPVMMDIGAEVPDHVPVAPDLHLISPNLPFRLPRFEVEPVVYMKVTDNWVELTLRYLVDPKKRRAASSFIFSEVFRQIRERDDIDIASSTMTLTLQDAESLQASTQDESKKAA